MQVRKNFKDESRKDYGTNVDSNIGLPNEDLQIGCLMRIADATEVMAKRYRDLIDERDQYKRWYKEEVRERVLARRSISALRGVITKLKKGKE